MLDWYDLNTRHVAFFLWVAPLLLFAFISSADFRKSLWGLVASLFKPILLGSLVGLFVTTALFASAAVFSGKVLGNWDAFPIVVTTIWTSTSGVALLFEYDNALKENRFFLRSAAKALAPAFVVTELVSFSILPLWLEIVTIPFLFLLGVMAAKPGIVKIPKMLTTLSTTLLLAYVLTLVSLTMRSGFNGSESWQSITQHILLPVWLALGALLHLRLLVLFERKRFTFRCKRKMITQEEYGASWPLTVDSARLCYAMQAVWVEVKGKKYDLNSMAKIVLPRHGHDYCDLREIWKDDPDIEGSKVNVGPLIDAGCALGQRR